MEVLGYGLLGYLFLNAVCAPYGIGKVRKKINAVENILISFIIAAYISWGLFF